MKVKRFVSWTNNDDKLVITNSEIEKSLVLNETGKFLWDLVLAGKSVEGITTVCVNQFDHSDTDVICRDISDFIELLYTNGMVE